MSVFKFRVQETDVQTSAVGETLYCYTLGPDPAGDQEAVDTALNVPLAVLYLKSRKSLKLTRGAWIHVEITPTV